MFSRPRNGNVDTIAKTLAAACGVAHVSFFTLFAWRVIGRAGMGKIAWAVLALSALLGLGCNALGYYLIKHGGRTPARKWGYWAIAASTGIAGALLAIAAVTA
ncbi:MAG: hypothetical protein KF819_39210 [Labilithrix sp.]|nr:hypothetical protein [Labilithrix sp.]